MREVPQPDAVDRGHDRVAEALVVLVDLVREDARQHDEPLAANTACLAVQGRAA
jgi:hypothetical protein